MESVRKGKVAKGKEDKWPDYIKLMKENFNIKDNFIVNLNKHIP